MNYKKLYHLSTDIETVGLKPKDGTIWIVALDSNIGTELLNSPNGVTFLPDQVRSRFTNRNIVKIIHSSEFDVPYLKLNAKADIFTIWDTRIAEQIIQGVEVPRGLNNEEFNIQYSSSLKYCLLRYFKKKVNKDVRNNFINREVGTPFTKGELNYAANDVKYLHKLMLKQIEKLEELELMPLAELEMQVCEVIASMRVNGVLFDAQQWHESVIKDEEQLLIEQGILDRMVAKKIRPENWNSPAQVKRMFAELGVSIGSFAEFDAVERDLKVAASSPLYGGKAGMKKNNLALSILQQYQKVRDLSQAIAKYGYDYPVKHVDSDGRIRCNVNQIINTGRMAPSNPNLAQLPSHGTRRAAFIPAKGNRFVIGDFTGQEIGIAAAASKETVWIDLIRAGHDIHSWAASIGLSDQWRATTEKGCSYPFKCSCKGHKVLRQNGKILNFLLLYGGGAESYSFKTGVSLLDARVIIRKYMGGIKRLAWWLSQNAKFTEATGTSFSASPYKRRRVVLEREYTIGRNNPIQAAGADMLKLAMVKLHAAGLKVVLTIHDEIIVECKASESKAVAKQLKNIMEETADYICGMPGLVTVEPRIAFNLQKDE